MDKEKQLDLIKYLYNNGFTLTRFKDYKSLKCIVIEVEYEK